MQGLWVTLKKINVYIYIQNEIYMQSLQVASKNSNIYLGKVHRQLLKNESYIYALVSYI